jgi:PAS domain S-box-containing protein
MSAAAERLTGYTLAETKGRPLHDVIHHQHPDGSPFPLEDCLIDRAFPEHRNMSGEEVFVHKDGHFYPVAYTASPIEDEASRTIGTIIEARDISAEKAAQEALKATVADLATERQALEILNQTGSRTSWTSPAWCSWSWMRAWPCLAPSLARFSTTLRRTKASACYCIRFQVPKFPISTGSERVHHVPYARLVPPCRARQVSALIDEPP